MTDPGTEQLILTDDDVFGPVPTEDCASLPCVPLLSATTRTPVTRQNASRHVQVSPTVAVDERVETIWDQGVHEARELAHGQRMLALSWKGRHLPEADRDAIRCEDIAVATALRCTIDQAQRRIRDAHRAVDLLPHTHGLLGEGRFPAAWFTELLTRTSGLTDDEMAVVDVTVRFWDVGIAPEQFTRSLGSVIARILSRRELPPHLAPENRRRVDLEQGPVPGLAAIRIQGPSHEVVAYARRLDTAARAVQNAQRHALEDGSPIPWDPEGEVLETGMPLPLARIRYLLTTLTAPDTPRVHVPAERFRLGVTIPVMTLMGHDDAPGLLDGAIPIPADMARDLAAGQADWERILTDPAGGEFLPLPTDRYRPTQAMLEHLRDRRGTCGFPGCDRSATLATEADHVVEFDHDHPASGGSTSVGNLHLLCWQHHAMKTAGVIDPVRVEPHDSPTDRRGTLWDVGEGLRVFLEDDTDMATPDVVADLEHAWDELREARTKHRRARDGLPPERPPGTSPPSAPAPPPPF
ncbi:HNH endonuclease signature motif containing protein [Brachybacterium endophyticum]|nr:HNH endonuclease signature motif containing protein [Brachybacterium endophyticum]